MNASEIRSKIAQQKPRTITKTFAPGIDFEVKRVSLPALVACGILPEHFYKVMTAFDETTGKAEVANSIRERWRTMDEEEKHAITVFTPRLVVMAVHAPRIVLGQAQSDDELSLLEIPEETQNEIARWVLAGCPGIPIGVAGGEVSVDDLDLFRQKEPGGEPLAARLNGPEVRPSA